MLVGLGGNNGSTLTAGLLAHKKKITWESKEGVHTPNFYGSFSQCATARVGIKMDKDTGALKDVHKPIKELLPTVDPVDIEISGWDISNLNLYDSCKRSRVLEPDLVNQLSEELKEIVPLKAAINPSFIAANQSDRMDNVITGTNEEQIE